MAILVYLLGFIAIPALIFYYHHAKYRRDYPLTLETEFFKVVVRFSRFMLLPEPARFPAPDSDLLAL